MYEQSQKNIQNCYEKCLKLDDIPGLLTINKVKPKELTKKSTRVTNVHGSMEGQDILARAEIVQKEKEKKKEAESRKRSKERFKELFYKCKSKCFCVGPCNAKGWKECPNCHSIMKSTCSKTACQVAGRKPVMICPASSTVLSTSKKQKQVKKFFDEDQKDSSLEEISKSSEGSAGEESSDNEEVDDSKRAMATIHGAWKAISPPNKEDEVIGKWFGVVYRGGKVPILHVAKLIPRFLDDENGPVASVEMECLMAKVGLEMFCKLLHFTYHEILPFFQFKMSSQDHYQLSQKQGIQGHIKCKVMKT